MSKPQWYEMKSWTAEDEAEFRKRLKRCRGDYSQKHKLLTQAGILAGLGTKQAILESEKVLDLFDELFPDDQGAAYERIVHQREQAWYLRAKNAVAYGADERAIYFFRKILKASNSGNGLHAPFKFGEFAVSRNRSDLFPEVLTSLDSYCASMTLLFPFQLYYIAGIRAVIFAHLGKGRVAQVLAQDAMAAAGQTRSSFSRHPTVGLVENAETVFHKQIEAIAKGSTTGAL